MNLLTYKMYIQSQSSPFRLITAAKKARNLAHFPAGHVNHILTWGCT